jgi:SpoVK/Ycf46/Vps4 family AAA+-type ATPase
MASAQQLIGMVRSFAEGDQERFYDIAVQLAAVEEQKGHKRVANDLRHWANSIAKAGKIDQKPAIDNVAALAAPRGDLAELLAASYPRERLTELVLSDVLHTELEELAAETRQRGKLEEFGFAPRKRLLLSGPPGTGKTMTAKALAGELKVPFYKVKLHGLISKFYGETATKLRTVFSAIPNNRGIYLFDEIDALAAARGRGDDIGEARRVLNSFLEFMEEDPGPSIIVAATNLPDMLDEAMQRRFDLTLQYGLPNAPEAAEVIRRRVRTLETVDVDWGKVGAAAVGLGHADLVKAAEDAGRRAVLADRLKLSTTALTSALAKRRAAGGLARNAATKPSASDNSDLPQGKDVSGTRRRVKKTSK